jgi:ribonuclease J
MGGTMQIKTHRGTHQVGGSITEIKTAAARLIIDMGAELPRADKTENAAFDIEGVTTGTANCDAVLVTHYHGDQRVLPQVPIYMGATAKQVLLRLQNILKEKLDKGNPDLVDKFKTFTEGKSFRIKDIKITPICVDHSAFDAYALLIEAEGKRILHTGDFRMHGARGRKMPLIFEKFAGNLDVLISEGSMLSRPSERVMTEHELGAKAAELVAEHKNTFVLASSTNIDRIAVFYNAAIKAKKPFVICDDYQGDILKIITENSRSSFYDFSRQKIYTYNSGKKLNDYMRDCGFVMMIRVNYASTKAVKAFPDNVLVYSMWSGYLQEGRSCFDKRTFDFIEDARAAGSQVVQLRLCEATNPKKIIPIHTETPKAFLDLGINSEIIILQDGESVTI